MTSLGTSRRERFGFDQAVEAVLEPDDLAVAVGGRLDDGANDGVEAGASPPPVSTPIRCTLTFLRPGMDLQCRGSVAGLPS